MTKLKSTREVKVMTEGGRILAEILSRIKKKAKAGTTTMELDREAEREILAAGGEPSFKKVPNYKFSTCLCVNDVIVHGLPTDYRLKEEDVLGIDVGIFYKGFHTDMAWTIIVGDQKSRVINQDKRKFLKMGEKALEKAINVALIGNHVGDISRIIEQTIEGENYSVVRALVGHGIGRNLHEDPQVPGFLSRLIDKTPFLEEGMTLAIEVIYNMGSADVIYKDDGWTIATKDKSLSGLFEKTCAITKKGPIVLTA